MVQIIHAPQRISRVDGLDKLISGLKTKKRKLSQPKMVRMFERVSDDEIKRHLEIIHILAGEGYVMTPEHEHIIKGLIYYFTGQEGEAWEYGFDIRKGIGLTGTWGVGKSTIFGVFHDYLEQICNYDFNPNTFRITSMEEIIETIRNKSKSEVFKTLFLLNTIETGDGASAPRPIHICINEFGSRYNVKDYGTDINDLIDMFLMQRYDIFIKYGKVTHVTTNYGAKDLEKIFGRGTDPNSPDVKLTDRFKEMWILKNLKGKSFRI